MTPVLFLSHSGVDSDAAVALASRLEQAPDAQAHGLKVWIDRRQLVPGPRWKDQLQQALAQSTAFAVYVGSRGVVNWVWDEVSVALDRTHEDPSYPVIPVMAAGTDVRTLPSFLAQFQGVRDVERDPDAFSQLLHAVLRLMPAGQTQVEAQPFLGLEAFDTRRAHLFFGREAETRELIELLRHESLLMVVGDSGSGKSSLAKAGVIPAFLGGVLGRDRREGPDASAWKVLEMRPLSSPFENLAQAVLSAAREQRVTTPVCAASSRISSGPASRRRSGTRCAWPCPTA